MDGMFKGATCPVCGDLIDNWDLGDLPDDEVIVMSLHQPWRNTHPIFMRPCGHKAEKALEIGDRIRFSND